MLKKRKIMLFFIYIIFFISWIFILLKSFQVNSNENILFSHQKIMIYNNWKIEEEEEERLWNFYNQSFLKKNQKYELI